METLIDFKWRPAKKTSTSLENLGYTEEQRKAIGIIFLKRFGGQSIDKASSKFYNMVRSSGSAHKTLKPDLSAGEALGKERADDIANRSKDAHNKAVESHNVEGGMTKEQAKVWIDKQRGLI